MKLTLLTLALFAPSAALAVPDGHRIIRPFYIGGEPMSTHMTPDGQLFVGTRNDGVKTYRVKKRNSWAVDLEPGPTLEVDGINSFSDKVCDGKLFAIQNGRDRFHNTYGTRMAAIGVDAVNEPILEIVWETDNVQGNIHQRRAAPLKHFTCSGDKIFTKNAMYTMKSIMTEWKYSGGTPEWFTQYYDADFNLFDHNRGPFTAAGDWMCQWGDRKTAYVCKNSTMTEFISDYGHIKDSCVPALSRTRVQGDNFMTFCVSNFVEGIHTTSRTSQFKTGFNAAGNLTISMVGPRRAIEPHNYRAPSNITSFDWWEDKCFFASRSEGLLSRSCVKDVGVGGEWLPKIKIKDEEMQTDLKFVEVWNGVAFLLNSAGDLGAYWVGN